MKRYLSVFVAFGLLGMAGMAHGKVVAAFNPLSVAGDLDIPPEAVSTVLQAELTTSEVVTLVERDELLRVLNELKLGQQGMVSPESARQLGKIVGARYFCSGNVAKAGSKILATVKVIDIDTTLIKVGYVELKSKDDVVEAGKALAKQAEQIIGQFEQERVEKDKAGTPAAEVKAIPEDWKKPVVMVIIPEMHIRQPQLIDPAAETEIIKRLTVAGFKVIDSAYVHLMKTDQAKAKKLFGSPKTAAGFAAGKDVEVLLYGEAVSEQAAGLGDFEGCRGRVELKAIVTKSEQILCADSAEAGATDLSEVVAGKKAIQLAANRLADNFLYTLAEKWNKKP